MHSIRRAALSILILAVAAAAVSTEARGQQVEAPKRAASRGDVDLARSRIYVFVPKTGFGHDHAIEGRLRSGRIILGAAKDAGELVFDMTSFDADTDAARKYVGLKGETAEGTRKQVNASMLGSAVLDVRRHPSATLKITSAEKTPAPARRRGTFYKLRGEFTLHGVTKPLEITTQVEAKDGTTRLRGAFYLVQTQFKITPYSKAFGTVGVADRLTVNGDILIAGGTP